LFGNEKKKVVDFCFASIKNYFYCKFWNSVEEKSNQAIGYLNIKLHELFILKLRQSSGFHTTTPTLVSFYLPTPHQIKGLLVD
jgi:CRISPR/Cas system endoribonuclease Cas6 (RAMP superfamily)